MKRFNIFLIGLLLVLLSFGCGKKETTTADNTQTTQNEQQSTDTTTDNKNDEAESEKVEPKILHIAESFAYEKLDPHKDYYGWYTSIYGATETLYKIDDNSNMVPNLAKSASVDDSGLVWIVELNDNVKFSNGNPLTAQIAVDNIKRLAKENERFNYLADFNYEVKDDKTFTITTKEAYPTMINDLACPEMGMVDLDNTDDIDNAPVGTGPFIIKSFEPSGTVEVEKNTNYWNGDVKLDGAVIYYMPDDETKLMAMQNGEIDGYGSVTASAIEIFQKEPDKYKLASIPATRLQFYILNHKTLSDKVRAAINLIVDNNEIADYLKGTVTAAVGPFSTNSAYGKVSKPSCDVEAAKKLLEEDGYKLDKDGIYAKNGKQLKLNLSYYAARSLDSVAVVMQEQLKKAGILTETVCEEDPDATYMTSGNFDIALYCMIADKSGDPYYFIDSTLSKDGYCNCGGFESKECDKLLAELRSEKNADKRAELANKMIQIAIDDNAYGYVGLFNKTVVMKPNVSNISENCPFDIYRLNTDTDM